MTSEKLFETGRNEEYTCNYEDAYDYFLEAAHMGNVRAIERLAVFYLYGCGVSRSYEKAFMYLRKAFDLSGREWASYDISDCRPEIIGCEEGRAAYRGYLDYLLSQGCRNAYIYKADELRSGGVYSKDMDEAVRLLEEAFRLGENEAAGMLAEIYFIGKNIEKDYEKAYRYLQMCKGNPFIKLYYLGEMHLNGICVEKNIDAAVEYYRSIVDSDVSWKTIDLYYELAGKRLDQIKSGKVN